jgi:RNA polymerase sigma-70 factor, ECF subfamily
MTTEAPAGFGQAALVAAAARGDERAFGALAEPHRRALHLHCYRMLGSFHDADDALQETLLRAWRNLDRFTPRPSLGAWLHAIATNVCLTVLERRRQRPEVPVADAGEGSWGELLHLQPYPDRLLDEVERRETVELAFVTAVQLLPPKQRAVLILRDVLGWRAAEVAELVGTSTAAVNSALQRARALLDRVAPRPDEVPELTDTEQKELVERYATAFEHADMTALTALLAEDAVWEMPPVPDWFRGRDTIARLIAFRCPLFPDGGRTILTGANGQPACALYVPDGTGGYEAHSLMVLTFSGPAVAKVTDFQDLSLFATFGLPLRVPAA